MDIAEILRLISLGIVVLWTVRLAQSKGLNPLAWGVGSALLMAVVWFAFVEWRNFVVFVGMAPLAFLLLFRSPLFRRSNPTTATAAPVAATNACPRCAAPDTGGQNYCVHCGWDLSRSYAETVDSPEPVAPATNAPEPAATVLETAIETPAATAATPEPAEIAPQETVAPAAIPETPTATPQPQPAPVLAQDTEPAPPLTESVPAAPATTPPAVRRIPTAANLTERGIALFSQGRFQEAVDQFTKAIALDPKYKLAWERRAEAYGRLGRAERQAADRRQLETI